MYWARGHKNDWNYFAEEAGDSAWNYDSVLTLYRRIEDWHGEADPKYRGTGGPMFVQPLLPTSPMGRAMFVGVLSLGIPTFENRNGRMMEGDGGCSLVERGIRDGRRLSVFRSYTFPYMDRPNLTVLTQAMVTRLIIEGKRTTGVEIAYDGKILRVGAGFEVVLSLGAINTPKVLMLSGIGDQAELQRLGILLVQHLAKFSGSCSSSELCLGASTARAGCPERAGSLAVEEQFQSRHSGHAVRPWRRCVCQRRNSEVQSTGEFVQHGPRHCPPQEPRSYQTDRSRPSRPRRDRSQFFS